MQTFRCPTCLFMLADPGAKRCPSCHKKLHRRGRPIVLGDKTHFGTQAPTDVDLLLAERAERAQASFANDPLVASVPAPPATPAAAEAPAPVEARPPVEAPEAEAPPAFAAPPYVPAPPLESAPVKRAPDAIQHTTMFEPSQLDPEMRQVLDSLYRKARSEPDDETS